MRTPQKQNSLIHYMCESLKLGNLVNLDTFFCPIGSRGLIGLLVGVSLASSIAVGSKLLLV